MLYEAESDARHPLVYSTRGWSWLPILTSLPYQLCPSSFVNRLTFGIHPLSTVCLCPEYGSFGTTYNLELLDPEAIFGYIQADPTVHNQET
jgi:hypothetical protein